jgi:hypothetical protein
MKANIYPYYQCIVFFSMLLFIPPQQISADERAKSDKCYITTGYVSNKSSLAAEAKKLFINFNDFELFERKDKKIYLTIGKTEKKLFNKLKSDAKTYNFNCSQGKGFIKRYSFDENFNLIEGRKKFIDFESDYSRVTAPIETEKKRLVDMEVQRRVDARMETLRLAEIKKQEQAAAEKERLRLAEFIRKERAEADRLAAIEKVKQAEFKKQERAAAEKERLRLAEITKKERAEADRLAAIKKEKDEEVLNIEGLSAGTRNKEALAEKQRKARAATISSFDCVNERGVRTQYFKQGPGEDWKTITYPKGQDPIMGTMKLADETDTGYILQEPDNSTVIAKTGKGGLQLLFGKITLKFLCN